MPQAIDYESIKRLIIGITDARTQALVAFQYASAARVGELLTYEHNNEQKSKGILKHNIFISPESITWTMPNFKVKNPTRKVKSPIVLAKEKWLYDILCKYANECQTENLFEIEEAWARKLIKDAMRPYASHVLRKSRATHLVSLFNFNAYEIMYYLGHTKLETSTYYVAQANVESKMAIGLEQLDKKKESSGGDVDTEKGKESEKEKP